MVKNKKGFIGAAFFVNISYFILGIVLTSLWGLWWGGDSWGNRFFTDLAVPAVLLTYISYAFLKRTVVKVALLTLAIYSVFIQAVGVFNYPQSRWDTYPAGVGTSVWRIWDYGDNPIARSLAVGPDFSGAVRVYHWISDMNKNKVYTEAERTCSLYKVKEYNYLGYKIISVAFRNKSLVDWYTMGDSPFNNSLTLKQVFVGGDKGEILSPLVPSNFPTVIKSGEQILTHIVVVSPDPSYRSMIIIPSQNDTLWTQTDCHLSVPL